LVNNAGILRDRMFVNMSEEEWDDVVEGQLKSTFCAARTLAGYWRDRAKAGEPVAASMVNVSSTSGLLGQAGQSNYGAAKAGIASLSIILAGELGRYGVRVNAITPVARTRMTEDVPALKEMVAAPSDAGTFDVYHPAHVAPLVAWLLAEDCAATGQTFYARGGEIRHFVGWHYGATIREDGDWTVDGLAASLPGLLATD
jgi:NAD(P)-dependent dehydrogenase (short-subunit alcohol dehydrogenase family)